MGIESISSRYMVFILTLLKEISGNTHKMFMELVTDTASPLSAKTDTCAVP